MCFRTLCLMCTCLNNCKQVVPRRCPLPYLVAVHHTNRFIYTQDNKHNKLKNMMLKQVAGLSDQVRNPQLNSKKHDIQGNLNYQNIFSNRILNLTCLHYRY